MPPSSKRLSKQERRTQLLDTALAIVREEGTNALTLATVAERAGVTKPIAYEHFGTREGLLVALYMRFDDGAIASVEEALSRQAPKRLRDLARLLARAYMHCYTSMGPEWHAISAALKGTEEMEATQQELLDRYVRHYVDAFAPLVSHSRDDLRLRCVAILGAAEAIAREMLRQKVSESRAASIVEELIVGVL